MPSKDVLHPDKDRVTAVADAPAPHDTSSLRSFLVLGSWYSKFILDFATVVEALLAVLRDYWSEVRVYYWGWVQFCWLLRLYVFPVPFSLQFLYPGVLRCCYNEHYEVHLEKKGWKLQFSSRRGRPLALGLLTLGFHMLIVINPMDLMILEVSCVVFGSVVTFLMFCLVVFVLYIFYNCVHCQFIFLFF